jgi:RimK-like ATP-grasp domain
MYIEPQVLIISNKFDFSTDLITNKLRELKIPFLRLNRDDLKEYKIELNPFTPYMDVYIDGYEYHISEETLNSIYYRAPTFLRDIFQEGLSEEEQLYRTQWAAFVRSLIVFENVKWVNSPVSTYRAEMKPYQLKLAKKIGFNVPETLIANYLEKGIFTYDKIAIKSIDTAIVNNGNNEAFIYTTILNNNTLATENYSSPFFIQQGLIPKVDIRVTIIDKTVVAIKIIGSDEITDDWRKYKGGIKYELFELPEKIKNYCLDLAKELDLFFCAIDFVIHNNEYYFIEVNPTGEWAWLQTNTGYEFDSQITQILI